MRRAEPRRIAAIDLGRAAGAQRIDVAAQQRARLRAVIDEQHEGRAARQRLKPERAGAGEQVEHAGALDRIAVGVRQDVEQRLAQPVGGRPDRLRFGRQQACARGTGRRRCASAVPPAFVGAAATARRRISAAVAARHGFLSPPYRCGRCGPPFAGRPWRPRAFSSRPRCDPKLGDERPALPGLRSGAPRRPSLFDAPRAHARGLAA